MTETEKTPSAEINYPRYVSTTGRPELLALTGGGHSVSITNDAEGTPLHPRFHRIAAFRGCVPVAMLAQSQYVDQNPVMPNRDAVILRAITEMVVAASDDPTKAAELFTNDGRPDARSISVKCGFTVNANDRDRMWDQFQSDQDELGAQD